MRFTQRFIVLIAAAAFAAVLPSTLFAAQSDSGQTSGSEKSQGDKSSEKPPDKPPDKPAPKAAVTRHRISVDGKSIGYTATAATIDLQNAKSEPIGRMFYVAYTQDEVADVSTRPLTFVFNGGPGSSTMWLHMGSFGPVRVDATDADATPPPPYKVADNPDTILDRTDLVFVDAMGTGFSRILNKGEPKDFYGTDPDVAAFAQFIERYLSANARWNSPKFLLGESYGTTRAAALLSAMQDRGVAFNGAVLVSCYLNAYSDFNGPALSNDLPYSLFLPTMAAAAWYHGRVDPKPELKSFLAEAREFALGDYAQALIQGNRLDEARKKAVVAKLQRFTGMPESMIVNSNLRVSPEHFWKELLRGQRRTIGRLDARFRGIDRDAAADSPEFDAADAAFAAAFVGALNTYARGVLKVETDDLYKPTNYPEVGKDWDDRHTIQGNRFPMPDTAEDLRAAMSKNPKLRIFVANGYYDFATPFFETEYTLWHMGLDPALERNVTLGFYESGHMIYLNAASRKQMRGDLAKFYDGR